MSMSFRRRHIRLVPARLQNYLSSTRRRRLLAFLPALALAAAVLPTNPARAVSQGDLQAQVDRLGLEMSILDEQYNQASIHLAKLQSQIRYATATVERAQAERASLQRTASAQAAAIYKAGAPQ